MAHSPTKDSRASRSVEERLRALEDERDIRDLIIRYAQRLDARDHRGYAELFAADAGPAGWAMQLAQRRSKRCSLKG